MKENSAMDEVKIWSVDGESNVEPLANKGQTDTESLLEETLVRNPDMLIPGLRLVGRQTPTKGGPLDLLGVDEDGRLVVFELKRGTLSRDAVAQIIDYASDLDSKSEVELAEHIAANSGVGSIENIDDFEEWYGENTEAESLASLRPLRLFLVGLGADDRTERMVRFLANNSGMDISLLTFHGFAYDGNTLLAKQVRVEAEGEPEPRQPKSTLSREEKLELIISRAKNEGVANLFLEVRRMFQVNWRVLSEKVSKQNVGLWLQEREESGKLKYKSHAYIRPTEDEVLVGFHWWHIERCVHKLKLTDEFTRAMDTVPFRTWPSHRKQNALEAPPVGIEFLLSTVRWETEGKALDELTRAVYDARMRANDEESSV